MSQLFASGDQSIVVSASASVQDTLVLPVSTQGKGKEGADGKTSTTSAFPLGPRVLQHKSQ